MLKKIWNWLKGAETPEGVPPKLKTDVTSEPPVPKSEISKQIDKVKVVDLESMTKVQLVELGRSKGIACNRGMVKAELIKKLRKNGC